MPISSRFNKWRWTQLPTTRTIQYFDESQLVPPGHSGQGRTHTKGLQSASDNKQHKDPENHNSVVSKTKPGVVGLARRPCPVWDRATADGWMRVELKQRIGRAG